MGLNVKTIFDLIKRDKEVKAIEQDDKK